MIDKEVEIEHRTLRRSRVRYAMLGLVFVNVMINYLDRANISVAGPALRDALSLSSVQLGLIFSAFGWSYAVLQIPGGWIADRVSARLLYGLCLISWSLSTVCQGLARGFGGLFGFRLATGIFEAPSYPVNNRIVTSWFPNHERAAATALYVSGQFIGLAFLTPVLVFIQSHLGWRGLFVVTGLAGLTWSVIWFAFYRDPLQHSRVSRQELDYIEQGGGVFSKEVDAGKPAHSWRWTDIQQVFSTRTLWGIYIGQFAINASLWFFLTWFPTYLVEYRGLSFIKTGYLASLPFLAACGGLLLSGFFSDYLVTKGTSIGAARKTPIIFGLLLSGTIVGANYTENTTFIIFFMSLAFFGAGMAMISWVFVSVLSPRHLIGLAGGVFNFMGNLASIIVPVVIGFLVVDGNFEPALLFVGGVGVMGACSYIFLVGKIEQINADSARSKS